jgi:hypothetical protein
VLLRIIRPGYRHQGEVTSGHPTAFESDLSMLAPSSTHYNHFAGAEGDFVGLVWSLALAFPAALAMIYWPFSGVGNNLTTIILV